MVMAMTGGGGNREGASRTHNPIVMITNLHPNSAPLLAVRQMFLMNPVLEPS